MWLQPELPPHFADGRLTDSDFFGQPITAPMRRVIAGAASCQFQIRASVAALRRRCWFPR